MSRRFDIRPTVAIVTASVLTAVVLIGIDSQRPSDSVQTAAIRILDESAERVASRQVGAVPTGRQVVSPSLLAGIASPTGVAGSEEEIVTEVASATLEATDAEVDGPPAGADEVDQAADGSLAAADSPVTTLAATSPPAPIPGSTAAPTVAPSTTPSSVAPPVTASNPTTTRQPETRPVPEREPTPSPPTTAPRIDGRFTVAQVINGTIGDGDGSNPNEEAPMGRHDAPLFLPQTWNWAQGPSRNSQWGNLRSDQFTEWRCAVIPEFGHNPPVPFRINVRNGAYYQFANGSWDKAFDVALDSTDHGAYLGRAGELNQNPFSASSSGRIEWRQEADGSFSAPWSPEALMMHFWAGQRQSPANGQTAEFLTSEMRRQQPDGQQVDLSQVQVLFQCGIDYYNSTGGQGTQVPGPGIATYQRATSQWQPGLWVTLPGDVPANSVGDFRTWLESNLPPDVRP